MESIIKHLDEMLGDHRSDGVLVVCLVREVRVDDVGVDVGVLGKVESREAIVFDQNYAA